MKSVLFYEPTIKGNDSANRNLSNILKQNYPSKMVNYDSIELTEEELKAAILEGKKKKYFHERNKGYWEAQESKKGKTKVTREKAH